MELLQDDNDLIEAATKMINELYKPGKHHVAAALRSKSGRVITAVNVDTYVGRAGVCAEAIAIGKLISDGESEFTNMVAIYKPNPEFGEQDPYVASPCGLCREMINDYCPDAMIIYLDKGQVVKAKASELLPGKFAKKHLPR